MRMRSYPALSPQPSRRTGGLPLHSTDARTAKSAEAGSIQSSVTVYDVN